ncbi:MAG: hypothetical protein IIC46_13510 [Planctomycetes bacterium]|nr:hypothetical protein [Planctomycetota bacterium]
MIFETVPEEGSKIPAFPHVVGFHNFWKQVWPLQVTDRQLGNVGLSLTITGSCPGTMGVSVSGATAFGSVAIAYGNAGSFTIPSGSCSGLTIDISAPTLAGFFNADALGSINLNPNVPAGLCGLTVQSVDMSSCTKSNTATL